MCFNIIFISKVLVGIATNYGLDGPGSILVSTRFLSCPQHPTRVWDPPFAPPNVYRGHAALSSAEVMNSGAIPPLHYVSSWHNGLIL
jgi:hypothetical protein